MADADHLIGALVITVSVTALAEVARPARFLNALLGACLLGTPWLFAGGTGRSTAATLLTGLALILLSLPRGRISHDYGGWNQLIA